MIVLIVGIQIIIGLVGVDGVMWYLCCLNGSKIVFNVGVWVIVVMWLCVESGLVYIFFVFYMIYCFWINGVVVVLGVVLLVGQWVYFRFLMQLYNGYDNVCLYIYVVVGVQIVFVCLVWFGGFVDLGIYVVFILIINGVSV